MFILIKILFKDVKGKIEDIGDVVNLEAKSFNKSYRKREVLLCDEKNQSLLLNLWNKHLDVNMNIGDFIILRNAKITEYNGEISVSTTSNTIIDIQKKEEGGKKRKKI